jgi:hypothetical protein
MSALVQKGTFKGQMLSSALPLRPHRHLKVIKTRHERYLHLGSLQRMWPVSFGRPTSDDNGDLELG